MAIRYANEDLNAFRVADVLAAFGLPAPVRGPCPLCLTGPNSQAFAQRANLWNCFACGRGGNSVTLYAALGGISNGQAVEAIAKHLGLSEGNPEALKSAATARQFAESEARERDEIESVRWRARLVRRDMLRAAIAGVTTCTPLSWSVLGNLYAALGRVEDWIESREYEMRGWL